VEKILDNEENHISRHSLKAPHIKASMTINNWNWHWHWHWHWRWHWHCTSTSWICEFTVLSVCLLVWPIVVGCALAASIVFMAAIFVYR